MFQTLSFPNTRPTFSIAGSLVVQALLLFAFLYHAPIFVKPSSIAWGQRGNSEVLVYAAPPQARVSPAHKKPLLQLKSKPHKIAVAKAEPEAARAGAANGSLFQGPGVGREARPALPLVFPDPVVHSWQLGGLQGDVIVEITIDEQGNVTAMRVLQSLKQDIDEKVIATLKNWRFKPATVDGVAISSRQDVHFHFPS